MVGAVGEARDLGHDGAHILLRLVAGADIAGGVNALMAHGADEAGVFAGAIIVRRAGLFAGACQRHQHLVVGRPVHAAFKVMLAAPGLGEHFLHKLHMPRLAAM